jgi:hypothetical protein
LIKNIITQNNGLHDYVGDISVSNPGAMYHSGFDFTPDLLGTFCDFLKPWVPNKENLVVIELGCGSGVMVNCFPKDCIYIGLDANPDAGRCIKDLRDPTKVYIPVNLKEHFQLDPDYKADILVSFDFFEHIHKEDLPTIIKQADNLLCGGGLFFSIIDTIDTTSHLTILPIEQWLQIFALETNWKLISACSAKYNETTDVWQSYVSNIPSFWFKNLDYQMVFIYEKAC